MGGTQTQLRDNDIDNDIAEPKVKNNDIDNDNDKKAFNYSAWLRDEVRKEISDYKLNCYQDYLFGKNRFISDCGAFINPAIKQIERFMYSWITETSEKTKKTIINHRLNGVDDDNRAYNEYTNTPLWRYTTSVYKVMGRFTCELCKGQFNPTHLLVHHRSYSHIGMELFYPEDVMLLCTDCHLKIHNIAKGDK